MVPQATEAKAKVQISSFLERSYASAWRLDPLLPPDLTPLGRSLLVPISPPSHEGRQFTCSFGIGATELDLTRILTQLATGMKMSMLTGIIRGVAAFLIEIREEVEESRKKTSRSLEAERPETVPAVEGEREPGEALRAGAGERPERLPEGRAGAR